MDENSEQIESLSMVVGVDGLKWKCGHMVPTKRLDPHAIKMLVREIKTLGLPRLMTKIHSS